jgi:Na+-translocating ferredoxin:NAD+ oxidoreductase RnfD subunit
MTVLARAVAIYQPASTVILGNKTRNKVTEKTIGFEKIFVELNKISNLDGIVATVRVIWKQSMRFDLPRTSFLTIYCFCAKR